MKTWKQWIRRLLGVHSTVDHHLCWCQKQRSWASKTYGA